MQLGEKNPIKQSTKRNTAVPTFVQTGWLLELCAPFTYLKILNDLELIQTDHFSLLQVINQSLHDPV